MSEPTIYVLTHKDFQHMEVLENKLKEYDIIVITPENSSTIFNLEVEKPLLIKKFNELKEIDENRKKGLQIPSPKPTTETRKKRPRIQR